MKHEDIIIGLTIFITLLILLNIYQYILSANRLGLDGLYSEFEGDNWSDSTLTSRVHIFAGKKACNFNIEYSGKDRKITTTDTEDEFCNKFIYDKDKKKGILRRHLMEEDY